MKATQNKPKHDIFQLLTREAFTATYRAELVARREAGEWIREEDLFDELNGELESLGGECFPSFDAFHVYCKRKGCERKPAGLEKLKGKKTEKERTAGPKRKRGRPIKTTAPWE